MSTYRAEIWGLALIFRTPAGFSSRVFAALYGTEVDIRAGNIGAYFGALNGSHVQVSGGNIGPGFQAATGSRVEISGGTFGEDFWALEESAVKIDGGTFSGRFFVEKDADVTIGGGSFDVQLRAYEGSHITLVGREFKLGGIPIDGLSMGVPMSIEQRDVPLTGILADGTPFSFDLYSTDYDRSFWGAWRPYDFVAANAYLAVEYVPEPNTFFVASLFLAISSCRRLVRRPTPSSQHYSRTCGAGYKSFTCKSNQC